MLALGLLGAVGPRQVMAADDAKCDIDRTQCATLAITISGSAAGKGVDGAQTYLDCHRSAGVTTGTCSAHLFVGLVSRTVQVYAIPDNPAGLTVCILTTCGTNAQVTDVTLTAGGRKTVTMSFNPTNPATVTINKLGDGTGTVVSSPPGISCGSTCDYGFVPGTAVTLTATLTGGSLFGGWAEAGPCGGQDLTCSFTANATGTIAVTFVMPLPPPPTQPPTAAPTPRVTAAPTPKPTAASTPKPTATPRPGASQAVAPSGALAPTLPPATAAASEPAETTGPPTTQEPAPGTAPPAASSDVPTTSGLAPIETAQPTSPAGATGGPPLLVVGILAFLLVAFAVGAVLVSRRQKTG
jgi:hypothetical protein